MPCPYYVKKLPFSKEMIKQILTLPLDPSLRELRDALIPALSFALLLRNDELRHLTCGSLVHTDEGIRITIVSSKTDIYRKGKTLFLAEQEGEVSVVKVLFKYLRKARLAMGSNLFLFGEIRKDTRGEFIDGSTILSYRSCLDIVKQKTREIGIDPGCYATHSARSGGASALAHNVSSFELALTGRWADARSLRNYVEVPEGRRFEISRKLFL